MIKRILLAFQFLTILPIRINKTFTEADMAKSSSVFLIVGLFQGILLVATDYVCGMLFHPDLVIVIVLLVLVLSNGGFHLDGLADTFDAIAVKSSGDDEEDRKKRLSVMRDGTTGPVGVIAIIFAILLKYLSLKNISHLLPFTYYSSLLLMPSVSKWGMVIVMFHGKPVRGNGLGKIFIGNIGHKEVAISTLVLIVLLSLPSVFFRQYRPDSQYLFYMVLLVTMYLLCILWINFCKKKIGGLTGDTIGALSEIAEIFFLMMVVAWSRLYI